MSLIYLAASYTRKPLIRAYAHELTNLRHRIVSRWLEEEESPNIWLEDCSEEQLQKYAKRDLEDIEDAEIFALFTEPLVDETKRAGRHVEFGYALALGKTCCVIGPKINIFHYLGGKVKVFSDFQKFRTWL